MRVGDNHATSGLCIVGHTYRDMVSMHARGFAQSTPLRIYIVFDISPEHI
jgi:hypothetical protein